MKVIGWLILAIVIVLTTLAALADRRTAMIIARNNASAGGGGGSGDSCSSCTNETFEGTGYAVAGWTEGVNGGVVNEDYTTAPAPIAGSQSLLVKNVAFALSYSEINLPNTAEGWMRVAVVLTNTAVNNWSVCAIADSGGTAIAEVRIVSGKLRIICGTATADTVTSVNANTTNYIWVHYSNVAGANNDVADVGFAEHPTKTRPTSGNNFAQVTTGTAAVNAQLYRVGGGDMTFGGAEAGAIYDTFSATTLGSIGDFP